MPLHLHFDKTRNFVYTQVENTVTLEEFESMMTDVVHSKDFAPDTNILFDLTSVDFRTVKTSVAHQGIAIRKKFPERGHAKVALLVSDTLGFGLMRMYEQLSSQLDQRIMVFLDREEAEKWVQDRQTKSI